MKEVHYISYYTIQLIIYSFHSHHFVTLFLNKFSFYIVWRFWTFYVKRALQIDSSSSFFSVLITIIIITIIIIITSTTKGRTP